MRVLQQSELGHVSGGTFSCGCDCPSSNNQPSKGSRSKNNNGFGNGPESGPAPGNSGRNRSPNASDKQNNRGR